MILDKLTNRAKKVLISAQRKARTKGLKEPGLADVLLSLLEEKKGIGSQVLESLGVTSKKIQSRLLESEKPVFSAKDLLEKAFVIARNLGHAFVGTEHLLLGILDLKESTAAKALLDLGLTKERVLKQIFSLATYPEGILTKGRRTPLIARFGLDLTLRARRGQLEPFVGREKEMERVCQILLRKQKNNPMLLGEVGVGRTALVRGLAQKIAEGKVATPLLKKRIILLEPSLLSYGGSFLLNFLREVERDKEAILFVDDFHSILGPGALIGLSSPLGEVLKPALEEGSIRCVGATTPREYSRFIQADEALSRCFQPVKIEEPTVLETVKILKNLSPFFEKYHNVSFDQEALEQAASLSKRFILDRYLPDKALDVLDEAASLVRFQSGQPPTKLARIWEDLRKVREEKESLVQEGKLDEAETLRQREKALEQSYSKLNLAGEKKAGKKLRVGKEVIAEIISEQTGIPLSSLSETEAEKLRSTEKELKKRIVGQDEALSALAKALRRSRTGLASPRRPIGTFLFLGPTGVGKTETAKALTEFMFGDEGKLLRLDMSDFMEKFSVSRLIGAPPGYVGYFEGGELTEKVRRNPYAIILFDEIEKAHPDVLDILLQISEEGELKDARGRLTDFKNAIIVLTSNIGADLIRKEKLGFAPSTSLTTPTSPTGYLEMKERLLDRLKDTLKPEFLNRLDEVVVFRSLSRDDLLQICDLRLDEVRERLQPKKMKLEVSPKAKDILVDKGYSEEYGARPLRRTVEELVANPISELILEGKIKEGAIIKVGIRASRLTFSPS